MLDFAKTAKVNSGFTLLELIATVIVIGTLAGLAVPIYSRALEFARAHQAVAGLRQIHTAESIYKSEEGFYFPDTGPPAGAAEIYNNLNVRLDETSWTYSLRTPGAGFRATATRNGGIAAYNGRQIQIDESGVVAPGAPPWPLTLPQE